MFISTNIFNAITRNIKNKFCFILSVVLCAAIGILFVEAGFTYYCIPQGLIAVLYLFIGYVLNKFDFFALSPKTQFKFVLLCCAFSTIISSYYKYDISFNIYENAPIVLTGSIAGGIVLFVCGVHLGQLEWHAFDWVKTIGVYSLYILCIHSVEYDFLPWRLIRLSMPSHIGLAFAVESLFRICVITSACMEVKRITLKKHKRMRKQNGR